MDGSKLKQEVEEMHLRRYKRCFKTRPDVEIINIIESELLSSESYYYSAGKNIVSSTDLVSISDSISLDRMSVFLSKLTLGSGPVESTLKYKSYISKTLSLNPSKSIYLKDWKLMRTDGTTHSF